MSTWFVPGRLEVFGKHTDYAGGRSLLAAVEQGVTVSATPTGGSTITATTSLSPAAVEVKAGEESTYGRGHWGGYLQVVVDRLASNFEPLRPAHLHIESNLPPASGMSSSSALVVALALALADLNGFNHWPEWPGYQDGESDEIELAEYMAAVENGLTYSHLPGAKGVGTFGGSEDHTAMLCCAADELRQFSFSPIVPGERVALEPDLVFAVAVSGMLAEKTGSALALYNQASQRAAEIARRWREATGRQDRTIADALRVPDAVPQLRRLVADDPALSNRLAAFLTESELLIPAATSALRDGEFAMFGELADQSQRSAAAQLGNQIPETNRLQALARELGALGSASFGAGFGGSVWALIPTAGADSFAADWLERYRREFPAAEQATVLLTRPGPPAHAL